MSLNKKECLITIEQKKLFVSGKQSLRESQIGSLPKKPLNISGKIYFQRISKVLEKKEKVMSQKTTPGSIESHVYEIERTEMEKTLFNRLGELFDYGNNTKEQLNLKQKL